MMKSEKSCEQVVAEFYERYRAMADTAFANYQATGMKKFEMQHKRYTAIADAMLKAIQSNEDRNERNPYKEMCTDIARRSDLAKTLPDDVRLKIYDDMLRKFRMRMFLEGQ